MKYLLILLLLFSFCKKKEVVSTEENIPETKSGTGKYDPTKTRGMAPLVEITPEQEAFLSKGKEIVMSSTKELGGNLKSAIGSKGTVGAIEFCNTEALVITKKLSDTHHVELKRVSDKNRNPSNKANEEELQIINEFKNSLGSGNSELQPVVKVSDEKMIGYYPILTNGLCLQCHGGVGEEITEDVSAKLKELFPKDSAVGYAAGELRGLWVVKEK